MLDWHQKMAAEIDIQKRRVVQIFPARGQVGLRPVIVPLFRLQVPLHWSLIMSNTVGNKDVM
jgi:hypothetical protein